MPPNKYIYIVKVYTVKKKKTSTLTSWSATLKSLGQALEKNLLFLTFYIFFGEGREPPGGLFGEGRTSGRTDLSLGGFFNKFTIFFYEKLKKKNTQKKKKKKFNIYIYIFLKKELLLCNSISDEWRGLKNLFFCHAWYM